MVGALVAGASLSAVVGKKHSEAYMSEYQQLVQVLDTKYRSVTAEEKARDVKLGCCSSQ